MSHELLYTSAQQGLKPGSYGFCTVLATDGISKVLQDRLESLSGYEHAYSLSDRSARLNPVNYSHLIVTVANQRVHLLSRIADAGADYSGRSNKLAHHVALSPNEVTAAGPAWALASPGFSKTGFDGTPRWLPQGVLPTSHPRPFAECTAWKSVCKDAGWAGVLAELTLKNPTRPITLIFAPGIDVLPLVVEAMSLLPPDRQWRTTFSTFFTKLPAGIECQWRFVLDGTPAADAARRNLQSPPINLASPGPLPFAGPLVEAARDGRLPLAATSTTVSSSTSSPRAAPAAAAPTVTQTQGATPDDSAAGYRLGPLPTKYRASDFPRPADESPFGKRRSPHLVLISSLVGGVAALGLAVGITIFLMSGTLPPPPVAQDDTKPNPTVAVDEKPAALVKIDTAKATPKVVSTTNINTVASVTPKPPEAMPTEIKPPEKPLPPVFANIEAKGRILSLPKLEQGLQATSASVVPELCKVPLKKLTDCELTLSTTETYEGEPRLFLELDPKPEPGTRTWIAVSRTKKDGFGESKSKAIGRFTLHDGTQDHALTFAWDPDVPEWSNPFGLLYCKLDVQVGSEKVACKLSKPNKTPAEKLNLTIPTQSLAIGIPPRSLASTEFLRFDLELHMGDWSEGAYRVNVNSSSPTKIVIPMDSRNGDGRVELEFRFTPPGDLKSAELPYAAFAFPTGLVEVGGSVNVKSPDWKREIKRVDQVDRALKEIKTLKDGFVIKNFQVIRKFGASQTQIALSQITDLNRRIKTVEELLQMDKMDRKRAADAGNNQKVSRLDVDISKSEDTLSYLASMKQHWQEAIDFSKEAAAWIPEMEDRFTEIEQKLEVRYSVYLDYGNERVVLAETNPPPKRPEPKGANKGEKHSNQEGNADDKPKASIVPF